MVIHHSSNERAGEGWHCSGRKSFGRRYLRRIALLQPLDRDDGNLGRGYFCEIALGDRGKLSDSIDDVHSLLHFTEHAVAGEVFIVGFFEIEGFVVGEVEEELGGGRVGCFGVANHGDGSATIGNAVSRFVVDGRAGWFSLQIGGVAAGDQHQAGLVVMKNSLVVEPALGVVAEEILDGAGSFFGE